MKETMTSIEKLFIPDYQESISYGRSVSDLFYKLGYSSPDEKIEGVSIPIHVGRIPFVLRLLGIPSGSIELLPNNVPHMIGFGQEKAEAQYRNMHDLTLQEMLEIPNMISDPDMIFRSNTKPNNSIIVCREVQRRENPVVLAMKINIRNDIDAGSIVVSGYEKNNSPERFFSGLYEHGYCIYDGERSRYFEEIKARIMGGSERSLPGPIPASAVTCTAPVISLSSSGISPSDNQRILTKADAVKKYKANAMKTIAVIVENPSLRNRYSDNLAGLGYKVLRLMDFSGSEILSAAGKCNQIACTRDLVSRLAYLRKRFPDISGIGTIDSFLPPPIFREQLKPLSEIRNTEKKVPRR